MVQKQELVRYWKSRLDLKEEEIAAFNEIKREDFILPDDIESAYDDNPLPILRGKTISQPTTVMIMTHALELKQGDKVLEAGAGSGYQAAIISMLIGKKGKLITTEVMPELVNFSKENLKKAGITNVAVIECDGSKGMEDDAPFDKIIITAACREFPAPLIRQLKTGGIIVGPVGSYNEQEMVKGIKTAKGGLELRFLGPFVFSPLCGKYGFEE